MPKHTSSTKIDQIVAGAERAQKKIQRYITKTPLSYSDRLSKAYDCDVWIKREDLQIVRSFKIRGALNRILQVSHNKKNKQELVCASAGNHAQGFAYSCNLLKKKGVVFMPSTSPKQKITRVNLYGKEWVDIILYGDDFDSCLKEALIYTEKNNGLFIHPFDDLEIIYGQATVGLEILKQSKSPVDILLICVGGGGLSAGVSAVFNKYSAHTQVYGCEPLGAPAMQKSIQKGKLVKLQKYDPFVDGAALARVGNIAFDICKKTLKNIIAVPEGHICKTLIDMYNQDAIVAEPAGVLGISALDFIPKNQLKGKTICITLSGGNSDMMRTPEFQERSLLYQKKKYYFMIDFPQRSGALRDFLNNVLGQGDDITFFEYVKKHYREQGPAVVGIETTNSNQYNRLAKKMKEQGFAFQFINDNNSLFNITI